MGSINSKRYGQTLPVASSVIKWNVDAGETAKVVLEGNYTLSEIINPYPKGEYTLLVIQDATGSRTLTLGSGFETIGDVSLNSAAGAKTILKFLVIDNPLKAGNKIQVSKVDNAAASADITALEARVTVNEGDISDNQAYVAPKVAAAVLLDDDPTLDCNSQINNVFQVTADGNGIITLANIVDGDIILIYLANSTNGRTIEFANTGGLTHKFPSADLDFAADVYTASAAENILFSGLVIGTEIKWKAEYYA